MHSISKQKDMFKKINKYWFFVFTFVAILVLYFPVLNTYFTGDDFFHFKVAQTDGSLLGFIKLFGFYSFDMRGIAFYRPIFREALYNVFYSLFGLNHLPFRILQFGIHFINIYLVYLVFVKLFKTKTLAYFTSFFFALSAANVGSLYYLAGGIQAQGALMFTLLSLLAFINKKKVGSFVFFLLALSSHELSLCVPILLAGTIYLEEKSLKLFVIRSLKELWVYGAVLVAYLYMNFFVIGFSSTEIQYKPNLNIKTLVNTFSWYGMWAVGLPEMFVDFLQPGFKLNPDLLKNWGMYYRFIFPGLAGSLAVFVVAIFLNIKRVLNKQVLFLIIWSIVGILPVLFLPLHKKTYYLQVSLPAFWGLIGYFVCKLNKKVIAVFVFFAIVLNVSSILLAHKTYWAAQRGIVAKKLLMSFQQQYPSLSKGSRVYIMNDPTYPFISEEWGGTSKQAYFILNGEDALQLLYKDDSLEVSYQDVNPQIFSGQVFFIAKLD